jgi:hypothetical protein
MATVEDGSREHRSLITAIGALPQTALQVPIRLSKNHFVLKVIAWHGGKM